MGIEQTYCRGPVARMVNSWPDWVWIPNRNNGAGYVPGLPDGYAVRRGGKQIVYLEFKAGFGSLYLGNPDDENDSAGWNCNQRNWYYKVAGRQDIPYYICVFIYPEREPDRVSHEKAALYMVPPQTWLWTEQKLSPRRTISANEEVEREHAYKNLTADKLWKGTALEYRKGRYNIPHGLYATEFGAGTCALCEYP